MLTRLLNSRTSGVRDDAKHSTSAAGGGTVVTLAELVKLRGTVRQVKRPPGRRVAATVSGGTTSRALGRGLDFSEVREYHRGDDVRMIDWNVTARSGKPHTKVFNEEKERPFLIALDLRSAMFFGTRVAFKSVVAARLAAMLAWAAASNGDRVGGLVFSSNDIVEIKPTAGSKGVTHLLNAIAKTHSQAPRDLDAASMKEALQHLERHAHTGSSIGLISDFTGFETQQRQSFARLLQHNHVAAVRVFDLLEMQLPPPASYSVTDGLRQTSFDTSTQSLREAYASAFGSRSDALNRVFSGPGNFYCQTSVEDSIQDLARRVMRALPGGN